MPNFRLAEDKDFDALYEIWMQDHVNPFMSFEQMSKQAFRSIFDSLRAESDIYVLEVKSEIVAVRRIIYGTGFYKHVAYFGSFGVHKDHLAKGYGKQFYLFLMEKLRNEKKHIERVELVQESDNLIAFTLAQKYSFKLEAVVAEGALRTTGTHKDKWYVGSKFLGILLNPELEKAAVSLPAFVANLPAVLQLNNIDFDKLKIVDASDKVYCYYGEQLQLVCNIERGIRRYSHIEYWSVIPELSCDPVVITQFLRIKAVESSRKCKKIEILISNHLLLDSVTELGFHYCGHKIASRKIENNYSNEIYADLSFFNIGDAKNLLVKNEIKDEYKFKKILSHLTKCYSAIKQALDEFKIDQYSYLYLENLAFQMIREGFSETKLYDEKTAPWRNLISQLPAELGLKGVFEELLQLIYPNALVENEEEIFSTNLHFL